MNTLKLEEVEELLTQLAEFYVYMKLAKMTADDPAKSLLFFSMAVDVDRKLNGNPLIMEMGKRIVQELESMRVKPERN